MRQVKGGPGPLCACNVLRSRSLHRNYCIEEIQLALLIQKINYTLPVRRSSFQGENADQRPGCVDNNMMDPRYHIVKTKKHSAFNDLERDTGVGEC